MKPTVQHELGKMAMVFAVPAVLLAFFPYDALFVRTPEARAERPCSAAFVTLTEAEARAAVQASRASWQGAADARRMQADLFVAELPDPVNPSVMEVADRPSPGPSSVVGFPISAMPPSRAAAAPRKIVRNAADMKPVPAFSRAELLKID